MSRNLNLYCFIITQFFTSTLYFFCGFKLLFEVTCFRPEELPLVFLTRHVWGLDIILSWCFFVGGWFGYMFRSEIAESCRSSVFNFLRILRTVLYSGYISLQSHQQCTRLPSLLHPWQHLLSVVFLMMAIVTGMR